MYLILIITVTIIAEKYISKILINFIGAQEAAN